MKKKKNSQAYKAEVVSSSNIQPLVMASVFVFHKNCRLNESAS